MVWQWHSDVYTLWHTQFAADTQYCNVRICKPVEPDKGRQPSQPESSKPGEGKSTIQKNKIKIKHTTLFPNRQPSQPEPGKSGGMMKKYKVIQVDNPNKHAAINLVPSLVQLAWKSSSICY